MFKMFLPRTWTITVQFMRRVAISSGSPQATGRTSAQGDRESGELGKVGDGEDNRLKAGTRPIGEERIRGRPAWGKGDDDDSDTRRHRSKKKGNERLRGTRGSWFRKRENNLGEHEKKLLRGGWKSPIQGSEEGGIEGQIPERAEVHRKEGEGCRAGTVRPQKKPPLTWERPKQQLMRKRDMSRVAEAFAQGVRPEENGL